MRSFITGVALALASALTHASSVPFTYRDMTVDLPLFSISAMPGETLSLGLVDPVPEQVLTLNGRSVGRIEGDRWEFTAPSATGIYRLRLASGDDQPRETLLNLFVLEPYDGLLDNRLNGYRIDEYPSPRSGHEQRYQPPAGFIELTEARRRLPVSPHFTLGQFMCKQDAEWPRYLVLQERLLLLLESLVPAVRDAGFPVDTLGVISGYRTPWYNRQIGNVPNSRHAYGDGFDFYIDVDGDGRMDDVNGDGELNGEDSRWLFNFVNTFLARPENRQFLGGLGRYAPTAYHGGFVHVDTRGSLARW